MIFDDKLKPCPFCGSTEIMFADRDYCRSVSYINCSDCGIQVVCYDPKIGKFKNTRTQLRTVWNSRAKEADNGGN